MNQELVQQILTAANNTRDLNTKANNMTASFGAGRQDLEKIVEAFKYRVQQDDHWFKVRMNLRDSGVPMNEEDKRNMEAYEKERAEFYTDDHFFKALIPCFNELNNAYRNAIGISNSISKANREWGMIALDAAKQDVDNPFRGPSGLGPEVTKSSPEGAQAIADRAEAAQSLDRVPTAPRTGPRL